MDNSQFIILIADDNASLRHLMASRMELEGFKVLIAQNGLEAINILRTTPIDLMLLDIMTPIMDGFDVLRTMQTDPELNRTPVIVTSSISDSEKLVQCIELGAEDCLFKPINTSLLWARVNAILERKILQDRERQFAERLATIQQLDRALNKTLDLEKVANITLTWAIQQTGSDKGAIGHWQDSQFQVWAITGAETAVCPEHADLYDDLYAKKQIQTMPINEGKSYRMCAPIYRDGDKPLGLILLECRLPFSEEDKRFISRLCNHAAIAIHNAQLHAEVQAANHAKTNFVAMVSHELKSPLTIMYSYLELFPIINDSKLTEKQTLFLGTMEESVTRMRNLISELDDITRIESNNFLLELSSVHTSTVVSEVLSSMHAQFAEKEQTCHVDIAVDLPPICADHKRVTQILHNLLSNAYKYVPRGGSVWITARPCSEKGQTFVEISVRDNGIGIPAEDQSKIFSQFFRTNQADVTAVSGTGLGLNITKTLVELQGGKIGFTSKLHEGSTFYFTLPTTPSEE
ncbi:MAG: hypothetical protein CSB13_02930 [Chloroflexi bacterium]|nr:MAG: hypothetical protein CSB13_02930 [Chloroflexota bacterium]